MPLSFSLSLYIYIYIYQLLYYVVFKFVNRVLVWIHVCVLTCLRFAFLIFFFFFSRILEKRGYCSLNSNRKCWLFYRKQCISVLFMDPQILLFSNFFIKNRSHGTIYTFKNYFATVFLVFSFQFQQNKFYPNRPLMKKSWTNLSIPRIQDRTAD